MSGQWHYSQEGAQDGPVDESEIIRLIQDGELAPGTPALKVGSMEWQSARNHGCFQVEIYPKRKRPSGQVAASTASKPASGGTSQSPRQATARPAATSSPAVTTVVVKEKLALPWVLFGVAVVAALIMAVMLFFGDGDETETDFANAPQNTGAGGSPPVQPGVPVSPPAPPAKKMALPPPVVIPVTPPITSTPQGPAGTLLWEFETGGEVSTSPTIGLDGTIYVGSRDNKVYALDGKSGAKKWEFIIGNPRENDSTPTQLSVGQDGTGYTVARYGKLFALNPKTGWSKWQNGEIMGSWSSPAIGADGTVYFGSWHKKFYALNGVHGAKIWEFETGFLDSSPAIGADGTVYVGSDDKKVYALDGKSGAKKWEFETGGAVHSSPAIGSDGTIYGGSHDKKLYALNGKTGIKKWEFETGDVYVESSPVIGADGTLYVGGGSKIYALKIDSKGPANSPWPLRGQNARHTGRVMKK